MDARADHGAVSGTQKKAGISTLIKHNTRIEEASFTLLETVIAMFIMTIAILQVVGTEGKIGTLATYAKRSNEAILLAKRIMSQVEYNALHFSFKDLSQSTPPKNARFDRENDDFPFRYDLAIEDFNLPIVEMLLGDKQRGDKGQDVTRLIREVIKSQLKAVFGHEILKIVNVTVYWSEGARRDSVNLICVLPNQKALDELLVNLQPEAKKMRQSIEEQLQSPILPKQPKKVVPPGTQPTNGKPGEISNKMNAGTSP